MEREIVIDSMPPNRGIKERRPRNENQKKLRGRHEMSKLPHFKFQLYVAGDGPHSVQAIANLKELCREYLPERHEIEIIDVLREPERALHDEVILTPMLVKLSPAPVRKFIGNLSQRESLQQALEIPI
jgi:circadian clock protein KaiB